MQCQTLYKKGDKIGGLVLVHQALMGGMGEVYLCLDLNEQVPLALKTFQACYLTNTELRELFNSEVATWIALGKHPNIVYCFAMEVFDNQPFMILEWVSNDEKYGTDLRSWLRYGALDLQLALDFAIDICNGLIHAGKKQPGIVHRDLKPENILVGQGRIAKITDFGLAKIFQDSNIEIHTLNDESVDRQYLRSHDGIVGTPAYMAPEQWSNGDINAQTDIYAVGCILYEMLTGKMPFAATKIPEFKHKHLHAPIPSITKCGNIPSKLDTILSHCLAKRQNERFVNVDDLLNELLKIYRQNFSELRIVQEQFKRSTANEYNGRGVTYLNLTLYEKALAEFNSAIQINPDDPNNHVYRAKAYVSMERFDEALADLNYAINLNPNLAIAYMNRAVCYSRLRKFNDASVDFAKAIDLDPNYSLTYYNRAKLHEIFQRYDKAISDYTQAIKLDPNYSWAYNSRGHDYTLLNQNGNALEDFNNAIKTDPYHVLAYTNRGTLYLQMQQYEKAIMDFTSAIKIEPTNVTAYTNRGATYYMMNKLDKAQSDFEKSIQLDPTSAIAYRNLGALAQDHGKLEDALKYYEKAVNLGDEAARGFYKEVREMLG